MSLLEYLKNLNCSDNTRGIWVNPNNINEFRIGMYQWENGGVIDDWYHIGSLDKLSFGYQSEGDALRVLLKEGCITYNNVTFNSKNCNIEAFAEAYFEGRLNVNLEKICESEIKELTEEWAEQAAQEKYDQLIEYFKNEYQEDLKTWELEARAWQAAGIFS